jgi:arylformamidase
MLLDSDQRYFEISPIVSSQTAVFPGDTPFSRRVELDMSRGDTYTLSCINTTVHIGAHADAPSHYDAQGVSIENRDLKYYIGDCQVISTRIPKGERISPEHLAQIPIQAKRVLFKTQSFPNPNQWEPDFNSLSPALIHFLADKGVILAGIDTPSIDPSADKLLWAHRAVRERNLAILEGIVLTEVPDGLYRLIALPLRLQGADASPVRAILLPQGAA